MPCSLIEIISLYVNNVLISPDYAYAVICVGMTVFMYGHHAQEEPKL